MSKYFLLAGVIVACLIFIALPTFARSDDRGDRVCLYEHDKFHGHEQCYRPGDEVSDLKHADIDSIRVFGNTRAILYEDRGFRGRMMEFATDLPDLKRVPMSASKSWHEHVGSLRVASDYAFKSSGNQYERYKPYPIVEPDRGVCIYEKPNYEGRYQCWSSGTSISNLRPTDWDERIASVRVFGNSRFVAFTNTDFHGDQVVIDHNVSDLALYPRGLSGDWNHEIASIQIR